MGEYLFGCFTGHLSMALRKRIERAFPAVAVVNYQEPRGHKRGWFAGPNRGYPFDLRMAREVLAFACSEAGLHDARILAAYRER